LQSKCSTTICISVTNATRYATEIDVDFVRKSVRAIGKLAIKIAPAAQLCISTLLSLVSTKVSYIVQEATVVIRNIFRKYPNQYESIILTLCENLDSLDEPEAKAAMIWVIGQYADRIEDSDVLLDDFLDSFQEETHEVQLALLTATVKLFIQRPTRGSSLVPKVLKWATEETDNPDLRDRGYMYWRLLSSAPEEAKKIVMGEKPPITAEESEKLDPGTLEEMCLNVGTLATVYLKPVNQVFRTARPRKLQDSPALQRHELPTVKAAQLARERAEADRSRLDTGANGNGSLSPTNGGSLNAAISDADMYFASVGRQSTFGGSPVAEDYAGVGGGWVVNQNAPQGMVTSPGGADGNQDLLM
jgi:AP-2 complex subunit beta-1